MGALTLSPEAGDGLRAKERTEGRGSDRSAGSLTTSAEKRGKTVRAPNSSLGDTGSAPDGMTVFENGAYESSDSVLHLESCRFPYYRSNRGNGRFPDAVLVKDVGVSCTLLNDIPFQSVSGIENYVVKQLKVEYNDLFDITKKITTYTKDILNHLPLKGKRKSQTIKKTVNSKYAIASQYTDKEGNACLRLRLFHDAGTQCSYKTILNNWENAHSKEPLQETQNEEERYSRQNKSQGQAFTPSPGSKVLKREKQVQTVFLKERVRTKKKTTDELLRSSGEFESTEGHGVIREECSDKTARADLKAYKPVILTNWREISGSTSTEDKTPFAATSSDKSRRMTNLTPSSDEQSSLSGNCSSDRGFNSSMNKTKFHTVNIRIVKQKPRHG